MFLEKYKHAFNLQNDIFEKNSIGDSELFGKEEFLSKEYINHNYAMKVKDICAVQKELEKTLLKYKFIDDYLVQVIRQEENICQKLDEEYMNINNSVSIKGNAFLDMFKMPVQYNYVFPSKIVYMKNIVPKDGSFIKTSSELTSVPFYIENINGNSFFIVLNEKSSIDNMLIEFYNEFEYSIFYEKEDGTLEILFDKIDTNNNILMFDHKIKYKKLYVISSHEITKYVKKIKINSYVSKIEKPKYGFLIKELTNFNNISDFAISTDSSTEFYIFSKDAYRELVNDLVKDEKSNLINENSKLIVNQNIQKAFNKNTMYLLEYFPNNVNFASESKIYGKELGVM